MLKVEAQDLAAALAYVKIGIATGPGVNPARKCARLSPGVLSAFDGSTWAKANIKTSGDGAFLLQHKHVSPLVKTLDGEIRLDSNGYMKCGKHRFKIVSPPLETFPEMPEITTKMVDATLPEVSRILFAVSQASGRYALEGVSFKVDDALEVCATDGMRCAVLTLENPGFQKGQWVIPKVMAERAAKSTSIGFDSRVVIVADSAGVVWAPLVEGTYPAYQAFFTLGPQAIGFDDRTELLNAVSRAQIVGTEEWCGVEITVRDGEFGLHAETQIGDVSECVPIGSDTDTPMVGSPWYMHSRRFGEMIGALVDGEFTLAFSEAKVVLRQGPLAVILAGIRRREV